MARSLPSDRPFLRVARGASVIAMLAAGGAVPTPLRAQAAEPIGIVDAVSGRWLRVQDRQALARGQLLYTGQTVTIGRATAGSIRILLFATNGHWERTCSEQVPCAGSYRPSAGSAPDRGFWAFLASFWKDGQQLPPVVAGSRAINAAGPRHACIAARGDVDLTPALQQVDTGRYTVRLIPAPGGSLDGADAATLESMVTVRGSEPVSIPRPPFGLYLLSVSDINGEALGSNALVLVRDSADERTHALCADAQRAIANAVELAPATRAALLAHTLYALDARHH